MKKAYPKMPDTMSTLLVINDDLMVPLLDWNHVVTEIGLYTPKSPGHSTGYLAEDGPFVDARCARLGAVGVFKADLPGAAVRYRFAIFENPHALPAVAVPPDVARGWPRFLEKVWRLLLIRAKLPYRPYHSTRHTYATWLLEAGTDIRWVQQQMGHASIGQTADTYGTYSRRATRRPSRG